MDKKQNKKSEPGLFGKGQRYWSVMLVGEHGRIVPFHRFKEVAIGVIGLALLSIAALIVLSWLYMQQSLTVHRLEEQLDQLKIETTHLKDERDLLKAKLVRQEIHTKGSISSNAQEQAAVNASQRADNAADVSKNAAAAATQKSSQSKAVDEKPTPVPVKWACAIKQFSVDYDAAKQTLKAKFRIYNNSSPKKRLSGRIVVVFKNSNDPPIKWLSLPRVPLTDGKPAGDKGKAFSIRNYRTEYFTAYGIPLPIKYNIVTVYVFLTDGKMLLSKDYGIKIEPEPTPTPTPTPTPEPTPIPTSTPSSKVETAPAENIVSDKDGAVPSEVLIPQSIPTTTDAVNTSPDTSEAVPALVPATDAVSSENTASDREMNRSTYQSDTEQVGQENQTKPEGDNQ